MKRLFAKVLLLLLAITVSYADELPACNVVAESNDQLTFSTLSLKANDCIRVNNLGNNSQYELLMKSDGNLVIFQLLNGALTGKWTSNTGKDDYLSMPNKHMEFRPNSKGRLTLYSGACPYYETTQYTMPSDDVGKLIFRLDGGLAIVNSSGTTWSAGPGVGLNKDTNCIMRNGQPGLVVFYNINVKLQGASAAGQNVYYKIYDNNNKQLIKSDTLIKNSQASINFDWELLDIGPNTLTNNGLDYTLIIYGLQYNGYSVAKSYDIKVAPSGIYAKLDPSTYSEGGYDQYTLYGSLNKSVSTYIMDLASPEVTVSETNSPSDGFFANELSNKHNLCFTDIGNYSAIQRSPCTTNTNVMNITINLPYQLSKYTSLKKQNNVYTYTKNYSW